MGGGRPGSLCLKLGRESVAAGGRSRSGKTCSLRILFWKQTWVVKREDWLQEGQKRGCLAEKESRRLRMILFLPLNYIKREDFYAFLFLPSKGDSACIIYPF